ncbi:hypothetical protein RDWZM_004764 [Blomia tropicalis]|uniref:Phosphorylase b kinase regulatory subunit n=1 Tax=Blomia tropicalis TaxID=40697 RepID=A0A9Q0M6Q7_BLOTA|nr:hypothetical protein RDWZM_004764 [Blomia tropicalis]
MRNRSNSGVRLDYYQRIVYKTILSHQDPVSGLLPTNESLNDHAWVRDNLYSIMAVWALSMAYKKNTDLDEDRAKAYELEQSCVKMMRGLLMAMLRQKDKVESFKETQSTADALHAKYSASTMLPAVGDQEWGHLQLDATSLFLLTLAQMTASGLQIVFNLDEVAFVQNLVFYIESAYCIPDYGIWERGDKTNHGLPELNASSIGMAKAALEAMNELDLFGGRGGLPSVIHVLADEAHKCHAVLESLLPRESNSKEVDASLLSIISFPAFAVENRELIKLTRDEIKSKLQGRYGCKRFLRDGYKTAREDPNRLYYEPCELKAFENIECEWPLFFCYLILDGIFNCDNERVKLYSDKLDSLLLKTEDGLRLVPEMYAVPGHLVQNEYQEPHSQDRIPIGSCPFMWAQSLYIVGKLLMEGFVAPGELDPLNRRLCAEKKPDVVVQVVILAEDEKVKERLNQHDIHVETIEDALPIEIQPARLLSHLYTYLGQNEKLNLSGRVSKEVGILATSKLYSLQGRIFAFTPQNLDRWNFYIVNDVNLMASNFRNAVHMLKSNWRELGRPTLTLIMYRQFLENDKVPLSIISTLKKIKSGYLHGARVELGNLEEFLSTSCITNLTFLANIEDGEPENLNPAVRNFLEQELSRPLFVRRFTRQASIGAKRKISVRSRKSGISGIIKRTRSIQVDQYDPEIANLRATYEMNNKNQSSAGTPESATNPLTIQSHESIEFMSEDHSYDSEMCSTVDRSHLNKINKLSDLTITENLTDDELINMYKDSEILEEQADILHYLFYNKGLDWKTGIYHNRQSMSVRDLLKEVYEKACTEKKWALVRHSSGMLGKQVEDLAKSAADLLVRQKQITVGMPPQYEQTIVRPLPAKELRHIIDQAHRGDQSTAMLTQELIIYLSMFIRTEPLLFNEMLRLRVGLIIQVMASELARAIKCDGDEASDYLLNLSPYEMKTLLHHILSGKEFAIRGVGIGRISVVNDRMLSRKSVVGISPEDVAEEYGFESYRHGQWLRRRRLDGALNRVPTGFYTKIWAVLEKCQGIAIEGRILMNQLTREMTPGELKFALQAEQVLNSIPQPEYRQLMVEALMVLTLLIENIPTITNLGGIINVEQLVHRANRIFLDDQIQCDGDATLCCARGSTLQFVAYCGGAANICQHFYDSAPSGNYGTMTYLIRATTDLLECIPKDTIDCKIS